MPPQNLVIRSSWPRRPIGAFRGLRPACSLFLILLIGQVGAIAAPEVVWSIGKTDGSSIEFAPGSKNELTFKIDEHFVSRDFPGHHDATVSWTSSAEKNKPYTIEFDLQQPPHGAYHLVLNMIFQLGAPQQMHVEINGRRGLFPIQPAHKKDVDGKDGNFMLLARQKLTVPIDASWLQAQGNRITLYPSGFGSLLYDSLLFHRGKATSSDLLSEPRLEPTVFFRRNGGSLVEICQLLVPFQQPFTQGAATIRMGQTKTTVALDAAGHDFGVLAKTVEVEALDGAVDGATGARISLELDGRKTDTQHIFSPSRQWKLFLCPKIHNDVGFTDLQPHVNELDTRNTDTILEILDRFPFYKFNFETSWLVENFLDCRPEKTRKEFLSRAAEGRAPINAFYLNLLTGICTGEELYRALYFTHELHRNHGSNFDFACLTDAPSHTWFLPTLLRDVGIKAFSVGSNQIRAPILVKSDLNENSPFYWEGVNGERVLMWYARVYAQWKMLTASGFLGPQANYEYLKNTVPQFLMRYNRTDYAPDAVMIYGAYADNAAIPVTGEAEFIEKWNSEFAYPRLTVASDADYHAYIEAHFANELPVYRGDAGAYWEDGVASSARPTSWNRATKQILPIAETTASLATIFEPKYRYPAEDFRAAWKNVLFYDEHTWGAINSISQPEREGVLRQWEVKESYSRRANLDARNLLARSLNRLCQQITVDQSTIFAFNWQNRRRTQPLVTELGLGTHLVDLVTDKRVPHDTISEQNGWQKVRFLAEDVPAMGYRGYEIRFLNPSDDVVASGAVKDPWSIENDHYRLVIDQDTGGIKSLHDKTSSRELVDVDSSHTLNQYLYVSGGADSQILDHALGSPPAKLTVHTASSAKIIETVRSAIGHRMIVETRAKNTPKIRSEYRLYDRIHRLDIVNTLVKDPTRDKEAVYFAFPFAAQNPIFDYQMQNGWVRPNRDQLPGACREWFAPQNVIHLQDDDYSVAWSTQDAPLATLCDINRGKWLDHLNVTNGHIFSYVMNNYWFVNYKATQGGEFTFRYAITSGQPLSQTQLADFDADTRTPVFAYPYLSSFSASIQQKDRRLESGAGSLLHLDAPNLQVVMLKEAEDRNGFILRLLETAGRHGKAKLVSPMFEIRQAFLCNGVEVNQQSLAVEPDSSVVIPYGANRFTTVRLHVGPDDQQGQ